MRPDDQAADQLNAAIDALLDGSAPEEVRAGLPPDLRALADTGVRLVRARRPYGADVRPTFLLGLEEQLRTDFRLGSVPARLTSTPGSLVALLAAALLLLTGVVLLGATHAGPTDTLYGLKRRIEDVRLTLAWSPAAKAALCLDYGWRRVEETHTLLTPGRLANGRLHGVLDDLVDTYAAAFVYAGQVTDSEVERRAQFETGLAVDQLAQWEGQSPQPQAAWIRETREALELIQSRQAIARAARGGVPPTLVPVLTTSAPSVPTATPTFGTMPPTATMVTGPTAPPTVVPTAVTRSSPVPTETPAVVPPTNVPGPEPTRQAKPRPTEPRRPSPTAGGGAGPRPPSSTPEPTPDCWNEDCKTPQPPPESPTPVPQPSSTRAADPGPQPTLGRP